MESLSVCSLPWCVDAFYTVTELSGTKSDSNPDVSVHRLAGTFP